MSYDTLQYTWLYIEIVEVNILYDHRLYYDVLIVDYPIDELEVRLHYCIPKQFQLRMGDVKPPPTNFSGGDWIGTRATPHKYKNKKAIFF
jgi:hypothetical protein